MTGGVSESHVDRDVERITANLRELFEQARRFGTQMARTVHPDLEPALYSLLIDISESQPVRASDLAARRQVDKGFMSRQIVALERLGLVVRSRDPQDSRASLVSVSARGADAAAEMRRQRQLFVARVFATLTDAERATLADSLALLNRTLRNS